MDTVKIVGYGSKCLRLAEYNQISGVKIKVHDALLFHGGNKGKVVWIEDNVIGVIPCSSIDLPNLNGSEEVKISNIK